MKRLEWWGDHLNWAQSQWEKSIWSNESLFTLLQLNGHALVWKTPEEAFHVECLVQNVKHEGRMMVWDTVSFCGLGYLIVRDEDDLRRPLSDHSSRSSSLKDNLIPGEHPVFQDDNTPVHMFHSVQT
ncbi:transposable element Tcb1 transposase [Trichonephila clavipes]|nr:transposable element Tcb1 transposase [Trichonephila clavipes]